VKPERISGDREVPVDLPAAERVGD